MDLWASGIVLGGLSMAKIITKGKWGNDVMTVICSEEDGQITVTFNGQKDTFLKEILDSRMDVAPAMGGTYYPEEGTMLAYYNILNTVFFSKVIEMQVVGDIGQIPYEDGIVF